MQQGIHSQRTKISNFHTNLDYWHKQIFPNIFVPDYRESKDVGWDVNGVDSSEMYACICLKGKKPTPLKIKTG